VVAIEVVTVEVVPVEVVALEATVLGGSTGEAAPETVTANTCRLAGPRDRKHDR